MKSEETADGVSVNAKPNKLRAIAGTILFLALALFLVLVLSALLTPYQNGSHTKETIRGMYEQPDNSVQVAYLGASNMLSAASPMTVYDEFGINGYNCSTSVQPMLVSYWILVDLYDSQKDSLSAVVVEPGIILRKSDEVRKSAWAERAILNMRPSYTKLLAIFDFCKEYDVDLASELLPLLNYHSRWNSLTAEDYDLTNDVSDSSYSHGAFIRYRANVEKSSTANRSSKTNGLITDTMDFSDEELQDLYDDRSMRYLDKIVSFCEEHSLHLIFTKTPRTGWDDKYHDAITKVAESYNIPFVDMSTEAFMNEHDLSYPMDFVDEKHPNIHGSEKISQFLGSYLSDTYSDFKPINPAAIPSLEADKARYLKCRDDGQLLLRQDLESYLDLIDDSRFTVFVAVKGDVPDELTESLQQKLEKLGMSKLTKASKDIGYVCVRSQGRVVGEDLAKNDEVEASVRGQFDGNELLATKMNSQNGATVDHAFKVTSTGKASAGSTSVNVLGKELCEDGVGVNFVVYDSNTAELIDTSCFELNESGYKRISDQRLEE